MECTIFAASHHAALPHIRALIHEKNSDIHLITDRPVKYGEYAPGVRTLFRPDCHTPYSLSQITEIDVYQNM